MGPFYLDVVSGNLDVHLCVCCECTWTLAIARDCERTHTHTYTHTCKRLNTQAHTHACFHVELAPTSNVILFLAGPLFCRSPMKSFPSTT